MRVTETNGRITDIPMQGYSVAYYDDDGQRWIRFSSPYTRKVYRFMWTEDINFDCSINN